MDASKKFWQYNHAKPEIEISLLITSYNTQKEFIVDCLHSIEKQKGNFGIELVWINDGSDYEKTNFLEVALNAFKNKKNNLKLKYYKMKENKGLSFCLHYGVNKCSNENILRMDSDDIMKENRIMKQINFMNDNPECVMCGADITSFMFTNGKMIKYGSSEHPEKLTWEEYKLTKKTWILNHPTLCFRKTAVLAVGNYNKNLRLPFEDLDLELRILKHYGFICNIKEVLVLYRIHGDQITNKNRKASKQNEIIKKQLVETMIDDSLKI